MGAGGRGLGCLGLSTGSAQSGGAASLIGRHELSSTSTTGAPETGEQRTHWGVTGVKWRCLKEQRKKFAITMTVNISFKHLSLSDY